MIKFIVFIAVLFLFSGCEKREIVKKQTISKAYLEKVPFDNIDGFYQDDLNKALEVFQKDCKVKKVNPNLQEVCEKASQYKDGKEFFTQEFIPYKLLNGQKKDKGLITGYYEPILNGSLEKTDKFQYPIYKRPDDLIIVKLDTLYPELKKYRLRGKVDGKYLVPYDTRAKIDGENQDDYEVICYVDSKVDRFFLEVQGSGKVKLQDGSIINIGYADQNGRKYYPIGKKLIKDGEIRKEDMSLQAIEKWCHDNPQKVDKLLNLNPSKVFFKESKESATGSLGIPLVPKRNIAVDTKYIPLGFPVFINTTDPITTEVINTMVVAADTGGAIKGEIRADFFWGNGSEAELKAGKMAQKGTLILFIPKEEEGLFVKNNKKFLKVD